MDILVYWIGKIVQICVAGVSQTLYFLREGRKPYPLGQAFSVWRDITRIYRRLLELITNQLLININDQSTHLSRGLEAPITDIVPCGLISLISSSPLHGCVILSVTWTVSNTYRSYRLVWSSVTVIHNKMLTVSHSELNELRRNIFFEKI